MHEPLGQVQFAVFENFTSAYYTKLQEKLCYYLLIMYMEKHHRKSRQTKFWELARAICNLHTCYNFALMLRENAPVFSQSEARNFFLCYIIKVTLCICFQRAGDEMARLTKEHDEKVQ